MGRCSKSVLLPLILLMNLVSVPFLHSYSQDQPGSPSFFSVGFYLLCHVSLCYSFNEILVTETRGRLQSNNKITVDDLPVFMSISPITLPVELLEGSWTAWIFPSCQPLNLSMDVAFGLLPAPLSPWTHNPRLFPHKTLTPPLAPPPLPSTRDLCTAAPKAPWNQAEVSHFHLFFKIWFHNFHNFTLIWIISTWRRVKSIN